MRSLVLLGLSVLFASGADAAIYAYALRERPPHLWCCLGGGRQREKEAADARFESHAVGATAIFVNGDGLHGDLRNALPSATREGTAHERLVGPRRAKISSPLAAGVG